EELPRTHQLRAQLVERDAGRVAGEEAVGGETRLDVGIYGLFGFGILENGLDDEIRGIHAGPFDIGLEACGGFRRTGRVAPRFFLVQIVRAGQGRLDVAHVAVLQGDVEAFPCAPRGN